MFSRRVLPSVLALLACVSLARAAAAPPSSGVARPGGPGAVAGAPGAQRAAAGAAKGDLTLLYGDDHVFGIVPPKGWVVDDTSGLGSKIRVVLYPRGQKWATATTVMYQNPLHQDPRAHKTLAQMIERDIAEFRRHSPRGKVTSGKPIRNVRNQAAEIRYFAPEGTDPLTAVAYFEEKELVMMLVLQSEKPEGFREALPAYNGMVSSYQFVAGNVQTPTAPKQGR